MRRAFVFVSMLCAMIVLSACAGSAAEPEPTPTLFVLPTAEPSATPTLAPVFPSPTPTEEQSGPVIEPVGPLNIPEGVNPLTGLMMEDPTRLERRPLLVKVSNESPEVKPLSGLSFADNVWIHQMEGWGQTRMTAVYWTNSPDYVGSVRSVRPIDSDTLIPMYDGLLAYSGSSKGMTYRLQFETPYWERVFRELPDRPHLVRLDDVPRPGTDFYHRLFAVPEAVWESAELRGNLEREHTIEGWGFDIIPPEGGTSTTEVVVSFADPRDGPVFRYTYDEESGRWLVFETDRRARVEEEPMIDRLTDEQLASDNVVILFAEHQYTNFAEDSASGAPGVDAVLTGTGDGMLVRDGLMYNIAWQHDEAVEGSLIRLYAEDGSDIPLKPGTTIFNVSVIPDQPEVGQYAAAVTFN